MTELRNIPIIDLKKQQVKIRKDIDQAIANVLDHGGYVMGPEVYELEQKLAEFSNTKHAITCSSGTDALLLALMAKSLSPNDAVLVPSFTFSATAEVVALLRATPVFVDVDPDSFNITEENLALAYRAITKKGLNPVGIISVDLFGQPCDYESIQSWCDQHQLWLICDAAQSFGACYQNKPVGHFGDITTTSFYPSKPLGCYGDGGAMFTNNDALAESIRSFRAHGEGRSNYDNIRIGLNARLDTLQAAILLEKLKGFTNELQERQALAQFYDNHLNHLIIKPKLNPEVHSTWAQYTIQVPAQYRETLQTQIKNHGISSCIYYPIPLHKQPAYQDYTKELHYDLSNSERLSKTVLSLPMGCDFEDAQYICRIINTIMENLNMKKETIS